MKKNFHQTPNKYKEALLIIKKSNASFLFKGNINLKIIGFLFVFAFSVLVSCNPEEPIDMETQNKAPNISVILNDFDENTPIGTKVGTINADDVDGDLLTYSTIEGGDKFRLDGTDIKTKVLFDFEDKDNTHTIVIAANDGELTSKGQDFGEEIDADESPENTTLPEVTYVKSLDGTEVTEDVSYTSVGNDSGVLVQVKIDKADNDPNNSNILNHLLDGYDSNGQPIYVTKQGKIDHIKSLSFGDALQLNVANSYKNGSYGVDGFQTTTVAPTNNTTLINQHNETVSMEGYTKGIQLIRDKLGISDDGFANAPNFAPNTGNNTKINWQITRAYLIEFGKKMQQTGAENEDTVAGWAAECFARVKNMPAVERRKIFVNAHDESRASQYWD